jgi:hypothetical protein
MQSTPKHTGTRHQGPFGRSSVKFSANFRAALRNSLFTLTANARNSDQFVSKNRETPDQRQRAKRELPSEHLPPLPQHQIAHLH